MNRLLNKVFLFLFCGLLSCTGVFAQLVEPEATPVEKLEQKTDLLESAVKTLQKFKASGYIQTQYQYAETEADGINFKLANRANAYEQKELENFGRFGIRRGRFKLTYEDGIASGVVQIDVTDKGLSNDRNVVVFKDLYLNIKDPWFGTSSLKSGIFDRPFGHEVAYSSSRRESPERARITQSLFPDERDLGAMLTLQAAKTSVWNCLKLEAGLFAGNGIKPQFDSHMDFIGRLSASKAIGSDMVISGGLSAYFGGVFQNNDSIYVMKDKKFELESAEGKLGKYAKRQYIGFDVQFSTMTPAGLTQLRAEYITGEHPGNAAGAYDFKFNALPPKNPVYMRKISGAYVLLTQDLASAPFTAILKYDWYNPNTGVAGNDIAASGSQTGVKDITMHNIGIGLLWRINPALKLTAYYDIVGNETTDNLSGWEGNRKDNVFTLRLQYKF